MLNIYNDDCNSIKKINFLTSLRRTFIFFLFLIIFALEPNNVITIDSDYQRGKKKSCEEPGTGLF